MKITFDCLPCFIKHTIEISERFSNGNIEFQEKMLRKLFKRLSTIDFSLTPPELAGEIHQYLREELKIEDPYKQIKIDSNLTAEKIIPELRNNINFASQPNLMALKYSIAGNIIDSGISAETPLNEIMDSIKMAENEKPEIDHSVELLHKLENSNRIVVLGDNAGEIFFDRLLLERLVKKDRKIFYVVKSGPILNDALEEDAFKAGINEFAIIVPNGTQIPGNPQKRIFKDVLDLINSADLVLSKGQANFETLSDFKHKNLFFLLRAKCDVIAEKAGVKRGAFIVKKQN